MTQSIRNFFTAWTIADDAARDAQILGALGEAMSYDDPQVDAPITDKATLCAHVSKFLPMCPPGARVEVADPIDERRGSARATVLFIMSDDMRQVGQYFADLDDDGRITRLTGFVGKGPE